MRDLERRGDQITHQIFNALNRSFVTPFDREDISTLASRIDDFVDYVEETARRMWLYRMDRPTEPAKMLARIICEQGRAIVEAVSFLGDMKQSDKMLRVVVDTPALPTYPGALDAAVAGTRTGGDPRNRDYLAEHLESSAAPECEALCFDPQTSGGLLAAVTPEAATALADAGWSRIGTVETGDAVLVLA